MTLARTDRPEIVLPIWIGSAEAGSIWYAMQGNHPERPQTHDLLLLLLEAASGVLLKVIVSDLHDGVFIGTLLIDFVGVVKDIDCRPSDAIAIAVRAEAPIFVADRLSKREDAWTPAEALGDELNLRARAGADKATSDRTTPRSVNRHA